MRLVAFSVENYRSITKAHKLKLGQSTVLVGPNNEGKSNLLKALVTAVTVVTSVRLGFSRSGKPTIHISAGDYKWDRDFPVHLQADNQDGNSVFELELELDAAEVHQFEEEVGSTLNGRLALRVLLGLGKRDIKVKKQGPGAAMLTAKTPAIAAFISKRLDIKAISSVRRARSAERIVDSMIEQELSAVVKDPAYQKALSQIEQLQAPIFEKLADNLTEALRMFLPSLKAVAFKSEAEAPYGAAANWKMTLDDGTPTILELKGDGVQSLAALALTRHASEAGALGRHLIIAIEEPESHLHAEAMHGLRKVLEDLSEKHQLVLTTHSPVFVVRTQVGRNILVANNQATPAKSLRQIREALGVRAADNLQHAELILIAEGEEDRTALLAILTLESPMLRNALSDGTLAIDSLSGGSNLAYKVGACRNALCLCHAFLDHDSAGRTAANRAIEKGLLATTDVTYATCLGRDESEFEDLLSVTLYGSMLQLDYGVSTSHSKFKGKKKWSDRMREVFGAVGKHWDDNVKNQVKQKVAKLVAASASAALNEHARGPIDNLVGELTRKLSHASGKSPTAPPQQGAVAVMPQMVQPES